MADTTEYHLGRCFKSNTEERRIVYRPDWSKETPWVAYYFKSPGLRFPSVETAQLYHSYQKDSLIITKD